MVLMTIGEVPAPETNSEFAFVIIDLLSGVLIIATVVGNIAMLTLTLTLTLSLATLTL